MPRLCSIEGCEAPHSGLGFCNKHLKRFKKSGSPFVIPQRKRRQPSERFWSKVLKLSDNECWLWQGAKIAAGYGRWQSGGRGSPHLLAHRAAYQFATGDTPPVVMHKCDTPSCVNPNHLRGGTQKDNILDMLGKGRRPRVGPTGDRNFNTKLDDEKVRKIRALEGAMSANATGKMFGVNHRTILAIWRGITWRQVE